MSVMVSQITSFTNLYSIIYSDTDQRKHQSSTSLAFVGEFTSHHWIPNTKGQQCGKCFHLMVSSWMTNFMEQNLPHINGKYVYGFHTITNYIITPIYTWQLDNDSSVVNMWSGSIYSDDYNDQSCQMTEHWVHFDLKYQYWHGCLVSMQYGNSPFTEVEHQQNMGHLDSRVKYGFIICSEWVMDIALMMYNINNFYVNLWKLDPVCEIRGIICKIKVDNVPYLQQTFCTNPTMQQSHIP